MIWLRDSQPAKKIRLNARNVCHLAWQMVLRIRFWTFWLERWINFKSKRVKESAWRERLLHGIVQLKIIQIEQYKYLHTIYYHYFVSCQMGILYGSLLRQQWRRARLNNTRKKRFFSVRTMLFYIMSKAPKKISLACIRAHEYLSPAKEIISNYLSNRNIYINVYPNYMAILLDRNVIAVSVGCCCCCFLLCSVCACVCALSTTIHFGYIFVVAVDLVVSAFIKCDKW